MNGDFFIVSDSNTYDLSNSCLFGELFLRCGKFYFPHENWKDLVASCVCMWLEGLNALANCSIGEIACFYFMDGPYYFEAKNLDDSSVELKFYSHEAIVGSLYTINIKVLYELIISLALKILPVIKDEEHEQYNAISIQRMLEELSRGH